MRELTAVEKQIIAAIYEETGWQAISRHLASLVVDDARRARHEDARAEEEDARWLTERLANLSK